MLYPLSYGGRIRILTNDYSARCVKKMREESTEKPVLDQVGGRRWQILGWMIVGGIIGVILVSVFLAYGQPELLLEQLNLRYCG